VVSRQKPAFSSDSTPKSVAATPESSASLSSGYPNSSCFGSKRPATQQRYQPNVEPITPIADDPRQPKVQKFSEYAYKPPVQLPPASSASSYAQVGDLFQNPWNCDFYLEGASDLVTPDIKLIEYPQEGVRWKIFVRQNSNGYIFKIRMSIDEAKLVIKDLLSYWTEVNIVRARDMILSFPRILCTRKSIALNSQIE
jgi:hypothetical protein